MITRREMLAAAIASGPVVSCLNASAKVQETVSFGFSLYGMKELTLSNALRTCKSIGYDSVELALMPGWHTDTDKLSDNEWRGLNNQVADQNLTVSGLMENLPIVVDDKQFRTGVDRMKRACNAAKLLTDSGPPPIETVLGGKPGEWDQLKNKFADRLGVWAKVAEQYKIVIAIKPHVSHAMRRPEQVVWLLKQMNNPWIRCAYDCSHFELQGINTTESFRQLVDLTSFIHIKDFDGDERKFQFILPGDGDTDYMGYFKQIAASKYRGPIVVEVSSQLFRKAGYDPIASAKKCYNSIYPIMQKAGLAGQ